MTDIDAFEFHEAFSVSHLKDTYQRTVIIKNVLCWGDPSVFHDSVIKHNRALYLKY